jgi:peptidoglycan/xylan/chitin deacetylase (PgdA/CDA1 family)
MSRSIPILTYHQIDNMPASGEAFRSLVVTPQAFARQMRLMKALGYRGLGMRSLLPYLRGEKSGKVFGITFDDGYANNLEHALPVLQQTGFEATCYFVSHMLGQTNSWDADKGVSSKPLMNEAQLRQWADAGQEVGSHGALHLNYAQSSDDEVKADLLRSRERLQDLSGQTVSHFCYPFGAFAPQHMAMVQAAGYDTATTTQRGRVRLDSTMQAMALPRVPVLLRTSLPVFGLKLFTGYEDGR